MSEAYEGLVFRSDEHAARRIFDSLASSLPLRLVRLSREVYGVHRIACRADLFNQPAVEQVAARVSVEVGQVIALFYDNSCGVRAAVVYIGGRRDREFGDGDAWWVPLDDAGEPVVSGPRFRVNDLQPDEEYDCVASAIDAGLEAVEVGPPVSSATVKQAFCYDEAEILAQK